MNHLSTEETARLHPRLHPWSQGGEVDAAGLESWVQGRLAWQRQQIDRLLAVEGQKTLDNTLRPYDDVVATLSAAASLASLLDSVYPDKAVRDKARELTQTVAEAATALSLNQEVYRALVAVDMTTADPATAHYVSQTLLNYRLAGVDKDDATRAHLRQLSDQATEISLTFAKHVQENVNRVEVRDPSELDGLPEDYIRNHPADDQGVITLTTDYPDMQPVMTFARSADLRLRMFRAYNTRAYPANRPLLLDLLAVRQQIASILGFASWADLATANQMMGSAANLKKFIGELEQASRAGAQREYQMVLAFARKQQPGLAALKSSDRGYWYEQYRREAFDFDSQSVRPYFPYAAVEKGILETAARLFHVTFQRNHDAGVWHPHVSAWDVYDRGRLCGRFYLDMHPREGKDKWFSAAPLIPGIEGRQLPEAALICNFPGGSDRTDDPGLLQYSDVVTFFHEFGHLMHAILGGHQKWAGVSGIATEGDFVEVPSQMLEEFFHDPKLLASFARHYQTGEPIPEALVERMNRASAFGRADGVRTQLFYTSYSLDVHNLPAQDLDPDAMLEQGYKRMLPYEWVEGNRMYASFTHLIGYTSNYYTYMFDKVIALDFFGQFDHANLLEGPTAMRYRQAILEPGGSKPGTQLIEDFLGRQQKMDAFAQWVGEEFAGSPPIIRGRGQAMASAIVRKAWQGKWAVVTGASAGIGEAIAVELAEAGVNLVLTARRRERLDQLAERLRTRNGIQAQVIVADLTLPEAPQQIYDATEGAGLTVDVLINNAGFGEYGEFLRSHLEMQVSMVQVNCTAVVHLTRLFLPAMVERQRGWVMIVASTASYQPVPYLATYGATKAFDRMLAEALAEEMKRHGVLVSALCPGPTESEFTQVAGTRTGDMRKSQSAVEVARRGLEGLVGGKHWVIPYLAGRLQVFAQRFVPRRVVTGAVERMFRPASLK